MQNYNATTIPLAFTQNWFQGFRPTNFRGSPTEKGIHDESNAVRWKPLDASAKYECNLFLESIYPTSKKERPNRKAVQVK